MSIKTNIGRIKQELEVKDCKLIAVTKTKPAVDISQAYEAGVVDFGENKVQELVDKQEQLPKDIRWHMIGHLQRNKVKYIVPFVALVHAIDSYRLLKEINKQAKKAERTVQCLLQIHIAQEESKFGLSEQELYEIIEDKDFAKLQHVAVMGLMGMATFTENKEQMRKEFRGLKKLFEKVKLEELPPNMQMKELSMGMSNDYKIALEEGSTMVRVGSAIFGERNYPTKTPGPQRKP